MTKIWNDSAVNYCRHSQEPDSVKAYKAALLEDKATQIDPDYYSAYFNKLTYLNMSGQFVKGLEAAKQLTRLHPKNIDHILQLGEMYDLNGDSVQAISKYQEALNDYDIFLKAPTVTGTTLEMTKVSRAISMILSGDEEAGKFVLEELYNEHSTDNIGKMIAPYRNLGRKDILNGLLHHDMVNAKPNRDSAN
jgi:tetratricopeptide (TPR) repeat protein